MKTTATNNSKTSNEKNDNDFTLSDKAIKVLQYLKEHPTESLTEGELGKRIGVDKPAVMVGVINGLAGKQLIERTKPEKYTDIYGDMVVVRYIRLKIGRAHV